MGCAFPEGEQGMNVGRIVGRAGGPAPQRRRRHREPLLRLGDAGHPHRRRLDRDGHGRRLRGGGHRVDVAGADGRLQLPPPPRSGRVAIPQIYMSMGETAENVAQRYGVSRERQEAFAVESQRKAAEAQADGRLAEEIAPVRRATGPSTGDGCLRPDDHGRGAGGAEAGVPGRRHRHRRHLLAAHRRRRRLLVTSESFAARARPPAARACPRLRGLRLRSRGDGHRPGPRRRARRWSGPACSRRHRRDGAERGVRVAVAGRASTSSASTRPASTSTAARSRSATRSAPPAPASPARPRSCCAAPAAATRVATQCIGGGQGIATLLEAVE